MVWSYGKTTDRSELLSEAVYKCCFETQVDQKLDQDLSLDGVLWRKIARESGLKISSNRPHAERQ